MWGTLSCVGVVCCLATGSRAWSSAELSDGTVFVQHRQVAHQRLSHTQEVQEEVKSFFKTARLHVSQSPASDNSERGVSVNREISAQPGGYVVFLLGPGCNATDKYGTNNCTLTWSSKARLLWGVHAPTALHQEDEATVNLTWVLRAENASSAAGRLFTGRRFLSRGSCKLCDGECSMGLWAEDGSVEFDFAVPMQLVGPSVCFALRLGVPIADLKITDWTMELPPGPPTAWRLGGQGTASLALRNASGVNLLAETITVGFSPSVDPANPSAHFPALASSSDQLMQDPNATQLSKHFLQVFLAGAADAVASAWAASASEFRQQREDMEDSQGEKKLKHLVLEYSPKTFENSQNSPGNVSLWLEPGCTKGESGLTTCRLPFGQPVNLQLRVDLDTDLEEGSAMILTAEPKVTGMLGVLFGSLMTPVQTQLPLCGERATVSLGLMSFPYEPGECGRYSFRAKVPSFEFTLPDISGMTLSDLGIASNSVPMLPKKLEDFPGMTLGISMLLKHSNSRPIADVEFKLGFER